jgi:phosphohistidine phosphatase
MLNLAGNIRNSTTLNEDLILSSPATRAALTARIIAGLLDIPEEEIQFDGLIYEASSSGLIELVNQLPDRINTIVLIGHNPELTSLANMLGDRSISNIPTAGCYGIQFETGNWADIGNMSGKCILYEFPKKHYST